MTRHAQHEGRPWAEGRDLGAADPVLCGRKGFPRDMIALRFRRLRYSQERFAEVFGLSLGAVQDQEQGRAAPSRAMRLALAAIDLDPELMKRAAQLAAERWPNAGRQ